MEQSSAAVPPQPQWRSLGLQQTASQPYAGAAEASTAPSKAATADETAAGNGGATLPAAPAVVAVPPGSGQHALPLPPVNQQEAPKAVAVKAEAEEAGVEEGEEKHEPRMCSHCGTDHSTSNWERHPLTRARLCGACRSYMRRHGEEERPLGVRCLQCGSDSPGPYHSAWHPHPTTGERWLCSPCFFTTRRQANLAVQQSKPKPARRKVEQSGKPDQPRQRHCLHCGTTTPGSSSSSSSTAHWHRHPTSGAEWLCMSCYNKARSQQPKQQKSGRGRNGDGAAAAAEEEGELAERAEGRSTEWQQSAQQPGARQLRVKRQRIQLQQQQQQQVQPEQHPLRPPWQKQEHCMPAGGAKAALQPATPSTAATDLLPVVAPLASPSSQPAPQWQAAPLLPPLQQAQQAQQGPVLPLGKPQAEHDLFGLLLGAAAAPAAAASGLTPEVVASFSALQDRLPLAEQAAKEGRLRLLLSRGLHGAAAQLMGTALSFGPPSPPTARSAS